MPQGKLLNIAHRGARSLAPENTLAAAQAGLAAGADLWELDVAMTADGVAVVIHDDTLDRTSNARAVYPDRALWAVADFSLEEMRRLDFGGWFIEQDPFGQIASGAVTPEQAASYSGLSILTLREALEYTRANHWGVNIEIKDLRGTPGHEQVVNLVVALVEELDMAPVTLISSFWHDYLRIAKNIYPAIRTAALIESAVADPCALLRETGAQALNPASGLVTAELVQQVHTCGCAVYVWTVNETAEMIRLLDLGVDGIFTDFPQRLAKILRESASA